MDRLQEIKATAHMNILSGSVWIKAEDRKWLIDTVEQYANQMKEMETYNAILLDDNKRLRLKNRELRNKTSFRVYEENLRLAQEIAELKGINNAFCGN